MELKDLTSSCGRGVVGTAAGEGWCSGLKEAEAREAEGAGGSHLPDEVSSFLQ